MNTKLMTACIVAGTLLLPVAGYTAETDSDRSSPKTFVKDSVITTKIKARLAEEKLSSLVHIRVDTDDRGVVTLSGEATSQHAADKAASIARGVKGVVAVENNILVVAQR